MARWIPFERAASRPGRPRRRLGLRSALALALVAALVGCASLGRESEDGAAAGTRPDQFTIVPDNYHVPYAGTAEDGRRFFLSDELFEGGDAGAAYVGLFLWNADGSFSEVLVEEVARGDGLPPGQAGPADAEDVVASLLAELGDYALEPITVEPFTRRVDGVTFGWQVEKYDGVYQVNIEPGDFIAYYAPWDGLEYDT